MFQEQKKAYTACSRPTITTIRAKYYTKTYPMAFDICLKVGGLFVTSLLTNNISNFILLCSSSKTVIS